MTDEYVIRVTCDEDGTDETITLTPEQFEGDQPPHPDESVVVINIDDAADKIVNALSRCGYLRWDNVR